MLQENELFILVDDFINNDTAKNFFDTLMSELRLTRETVSFNGVNYTPNRFIDFVSDEGISYKYSGVNKIGNSWTPCLLKIRELVENFTGEKFNSVLCNYYPDGNSGLGWHTDSEPDMEDNPLIASISLGSERDFQIRKINKTSLEPITTMKLPNGSLIIMKRGMQKTHLHCVPRRPKIKSGRLNLTFRIMKVPSS